MKLVTIDPGLRHCGVAVFDISRQLACAGLARNPVGTIRGPMAWVSMARAVHEWLRTHGIEQADELVLEVPQSYRAPHQKGDQNDLIEVAGVVGALGNMPLRCAVGFVTPRQWKGTLDGDLMLGRIRERLTPAELDRIDDVPASLLHNVEDGVGIGLHILGRLAPHRVYPR
jgi:hypothetical protein